MTAPDWERLARLLSTDGLTAFPPAERRRLDVLRRDVEERERALDDRLIVGIVGGTGVGKSTFINAIAAAEVSRAGDRRPTTDRVIAYRHRSQALPPRLPREALASPEAVHDQSALERLLILDFPDFDSVEADHPRILDRYLPHLDLLFVLVDPEKYADQKLHELLARLPQAKGNVHFVVNKRDQIDERYPGRAEAVVAEIVADFVAKLAEHAGIGAAASAIRVISARQALDRRLSGNPGVEHGFAAVLELLGSYKEEKRRRAAQAANLGALREEFLDAVRERVEDGEAAKRGARARAALGAREGELERLLASLCLEVIDPRTRRALEAGLLDRAAARLPFPISWVAGLLGARRSGPVPTADAVAAEAGVHLEPHERSLDLAARELRHLVHEATGASPAAVEPVPFREPARELRRALDAGLERVVRRSRWRTPLLQSALALLALWFVLQPVLSRALAAWAEGKPLAWSALWIVSLQAIVDFLSPGNILLFLGLVVCAYALCLVWDLRALRREVERAVEAFTASVARGARERRRAQFALLAAPLDAWQKERAEIQELVRTSESSRLCSDR